MAPTHTTNGAFTNPEVRYERTDINYRSVVNFGIAFILLIPLSMLAMGILFYYINDFEKSTRKTALPPAYSSRQWPPEPRLEALEDIARRDVALMPPRAQSFLAGQEQILAEGAPRAGILPITTALRNLAGKLPVLKKPANGAPENFTTRLPSKAASGRLTTGGQ